MVLESGIPDPGSGKNLFRIPDPGVKKAPGSWIPDPDPQHWDKGSTAFLISGSGIRDGKNPDPGWKKFESGNRDPG